MTDKIKLTLEDLGVLMQTAERNGTTHAWQAVAMEWCGNAIDEIKHQQLCIRDLNGSLNEKRAEIERLRAALNDIAQHQDSEWPLRCRMNVRTARAALKEPT